VTALYAEYTASTPEDVARQVEERRARERASFHAGRRPQSQYILLPWTMEELPGTTWRNAYTFAPETVKELNTDNFGKTGPDPAKTSGIMFSLGLWRGDRFIVEHWVRVDHLPAKVQQAWAAARVGYCRQEVRTAQQDYADAKAGTKHYSSPTYQKRHLQWKEKDLAQARQELAELTQRLGLTLALDIRNVGATQGDQLALL